MKKNSLIFVLIHFIYISKLFAQPAYCDEFPTFQKNYAFPNDLQNIEAATNGEIWAMADNFLYKFDALGELIWQKQYFSSTFSNLGDWSGHFSFTSDGGCVLATTGGNIGAQQATIFILKINTNGDIEWTQSFQSTDFEMISITNGVSILELPNGNIYVKGAVRGSGLPGDRRTFYQLLFSADGDLLWNKYFDNDHDLLFTSRNRAVQLSNNGDIFIGGKNQVGNTRFPFLMKINMDGELLWMKQYDYESNNIHFKVLPTGEILLGASGSINSTNVVPMILMKLDVEGKEIWTKEIINDDLKLIFSDINLDAQGDLIISMYSTFSLENKKMLLAKMTADGDLKYFHSNGKDTLDAINLMTFNMDNDQIGFYGYSFHLSKYLITKTCSNGFALGCDIESESIAINPAAAINIIDIATDVVPLSGSLQSNNISVNSTFTLSSENVCPVITSLNDIYKNNNITFFPNPTSGVIQIKDFTKIEKSKYKIHSLLGELIQVGELNNSKTINLSHVSSGVYFISIYFKNEIIIKKIIKN